MFVTRLRGESFYRRFESMDDVYAARKSLRKTEVLWVTPIPFDDGYLVVVENNSSSTGE